jgi:SAM-dependent methyltransferase
VSSYSSPDLKSRISNLPPPPCDLCGASGALFVLATPRLDGPLVRCAACGLFYVALPEPLREEAAPAALNESEQAAREMSRLAARARELGLVEAGVEEGEWRWREMTARERFDDLVRVTGAAKAGAGDGASGGRLLEIGCSTGDFLSAAREAFEVYGVEADAAACAVARSRGLECFNGALADAEFPAAHFDVVALYHVIEHLPSPARTLREIRRVLKPGGRLVVETPNIATPWFRLLGARWRQFIPDHIFFFSPRTLTLACEQGGFAVREVRAVGKAMSVRLFISRVGRYSRPLARSLTALSRRCGFADRTLRLNLGDVMRVYAQARSQESGVRSQNEEISPHIQTPDSRLH